MRLLHLWISALGGVFLISGCNPSFDAEEKNNKSAIDAGHQDVTLRLAAASEAANDLEAAERMYLQIAKSGSTQSLIDLASFYTRHNQAERAVAVLDNAASKTPSDMNLLRTLANSLISADKPEKALAMLDSAIAGNQTDAYLYNSQGVAFDKLGRYNEAQQSYRKAIALNPNDEMDFKTNLSMSHILAGEYNNAIELLQPLLNNNNTTSGVRQNLALAYGLKGDMETAMKIGSKDLSIREMNENIRFYQLVAKGRDHGKSVAIATPVIVQSPPLLPTEPEIVKSPPPPPILVSSTQKSVIPTPTAQDPLIAAPPPIIKASAPKAIIAPQPIITPPKTVMPASMPDENKEEAKSHSPSPEIIVSPKPPVTPPQADVPASMPNDKKEAKSPSAVIIRPVKKPVSVAPTEALEDLAPSAGSADIAEQSAFENGKIPMPVLKPDKW